ncbi:MAG TPA: MFS transporter [Anaeromyxobacter sp.]
MRPTLAASASAAAERKLPVLGRLVDVRGPEVAGLLWGFLYMFALLYGYYLLRPVREEMGIRGDPGKLQWVFTATFVVMLGAVPLYSALVARVPRRRAVPWVYRFFVLHLVVFRALIRAGVAPPWVARAFFVWVSVYNLFVVSVFWSLLADVFTSGQAKRLFGFIAAGGTAGGLLGSATVAWLAGRVGVANIVLLSAALLELAAWCATGLARWARRGPAPDAGAPGRRDESALGGSAWAGFAAIARSPYLLGIAAHMLLFALASTFLYFSLARTVAAAFPTPAARAALFANVDLVIGLLALGTQSVATGRIVAAVGLRGALASVPAMTIGGFAVAAALPGLWTLAIFQTLRRALHFAVDRPAREVLFTVAAPEDKYKAKSFVDTFVYRGGDALGGWLYTLLAGLGLALPALAVAAIPLGFLSLALAMWLARRERGLEEGRA